jgi:hypothetical protein
MASVIPAPAASAEEIKDSAKRGPIKASIDKIAVKDSAPARSAQSTTTRRSQSTPTRDTSFFKSKPGIIALTVLAIGAGYAIYSTQNDRITSPGKE